MRILTFNCGSSSLKAALIDTEGAVRLLDVRATELNGHSARLEIDGRATALGDRRGYEAAVDRVIDEVRNRTAELGAVDAVAHRIVHGGPRLSRPVRLDAAILDELHELSVLAPLHNPPALTAAMRARAALDLVPHIAVFDTAFHATLPSPVRHYGLPRELCDRLGIRRYGFHGISHAHVARSAAEYLCTTPQQLRIVSCHLGNGASVTAIAHGNSVETSMGMTPLEGLVMGTRSGDLDPGVIIHLQRAGGYDAAALDDLLSNHSGLDGLSGTNDMRQIEQRAQTGDEDCRLAIDIYAHRVRKYIGAYAAAMAGIDVIALTGGIGEHSANMRAHVLRRFDFLGAVLDEDRNRTAVPTQDAPVIDIATAPSRVRLLVIRADEELAMARDAEQVLAAER